MNSTDHVHNFTTVYTGNYLSFKQITIKVGQTETNLLGFSASWKLKDTNIEKYIFENHILNLSALQ